MKFHMYNMWIKTILVLTALIYLNVNNLAQAITFDNLGKPEINVPKLAGRWIVLASSRDIDKAACVNYNIKPESDRSFVMNITSIVDPDGEEPYEYSEIKNSVCYARVESDRTIRVRHLRSPSAEIFMFNVQYDTCIAIYTQTLQTVVSSEAGNIRLLCRNEPLINDLYQDVLITPYFLKGHTNSFSPLSRAQCPI